MPQSCIVLYHTARNASSCVLLQPIKFQTASGRVETAVLHMFEIQTAASLPEASVASAASKTNSSEMRICALHQRSPVQTFMFDSHGVLLHANKAALASVQTGTASGSALLYHS